MKKPADVYDREREWAALADFVGGEDAVRLGIVYGRRRQGKSWLLRRLVKAAGGVYVMALQHDRGSALSRFGTALAEASGLGSVRLSLGDWGEALRSAREVLGRSGHRLLVLDEYPYLVEHSADLPSELQALYDDVRSEGNAAPLRVVLCGSAMSVMESLLSGGSPLRGRTQLELRLRAFDYRRAADYWEAANPDVAFHVHAVLGGTAGYRDLVQEAVPGTTAGVASWLSRTVLNPASALFTEADFLLREDPRIQDRAGYHGILEAVSAGRSTPSAIGAHVGRDRTALSWPLDVLKTAGFLTVSQDVRKQRGASIRIADEIVRFHHVITRPRLSQFEERRFDMAWKAAVPTFQAQVLGPHFEQLAREWVRLYAGAATVGGELGEVGFTVLADRDQRSKLEVDVVGLAAGERVGRRDSRIVCIGEAKSSERRRTPADLTRLERSQALLLADGADCADAKLLLFGRAGFSKSLETAAARRGDTELIDLQRLYAGN